MQHSDESQTVERIASLALERARKLGATAAETAVSNGKGLSTNVRLGEVDTIEHHRDRGMGVTVYFDQCKGSASTNDLTEAAVVDTVEAACNIARATAQDVYAGLADPELMATQFPELDLYHPWELSADAGIEQALECEAAARDLDERISNSEGASLSTYTGLSVYANSHGFVGAYRGTRHSISCALIAGQADRMQRDYWYSVARAPQDLESAIEVGRRAGQRTLSRLGARQIPTGEYPVLFSADIARSLFGHFLAAVRGGALYRKASFLLDSIGEQIFPEFVSLAEQPHLKRALGSAPFDSEGVATKDRLLVEAGVVQGYVLDSYSARKLDMQTTANAGGVHNLVVSSGDKSAPELLAQLGRGLLVTELMGQGVNNVTGDYSRGAAGYWVESGEIQHAVEEVTIAGNLREMFKRIVAVGNDVDIRGNVRTGSVLLERLTVAGQ